ncbi:hypothetical protein E0H93_32065 [Rhizobium leguminosarum bv. viciae]|uniref:hypothetical protein n=1 Tax=Rhizobium leguminosarum TaxID=384 RepID=UPI00103C5472|nr:hypothetical protein [Rhizobium leguminosarum]TBY21689.1 hypothetical protein E0H55_34090 [Rhizobium leguminosarum bv. viciae]TCA96765.1 hypothetical protein E0H93_32065 [Rhizobium leguminosarum bv. viciae]
MSLLDKLAVVVLAATTSAVALVQTAGAECEGSVRYLSDTNDAYKVLQGKQQEIYEGNTKLLAGDPYLREQLTTKGGIQTLDDVVRILARMDLVDEQFGRQVVQFLRCEPLPTKFESPLSFMLLKNSLESLTSARIKLYPNSQLPLFGSMPTGTIDAQATVFEGAENPIIILDRNIYQFTGKFSKTVSATIPIGSDDNNVSLSYDKEEMRRRLHDNPWIVSDFTQAMVLFVTSGSPKNAHETLLDADHNRLHARLVNGLDTFIVGHELGHIVLGHARNSTHELHMAGDGSDRPIEVVDHSQDDELAADQVGFQLLVTSQAAGGGPGDLLDATIAAAGSDLFFKLLDVADQYRGTIGMPTFSDKAHPPASARSANLDRYLQSTDMASIGLEKYPDFRLLTRSALDVLVEEATPDLVKAFADYKAGKH